MPKWKQRNAVPILANGRLIHCDAARCTIGTRAPLSKLSNHLEFQSRITYRGVRVTHVAAVHRVLSIRRFFPEQRTRRPREISVAVKSPRLLVSTAASRDARSNLNIAQQLRSNP